MGTACYVKGSERLMERFSDILKIKEKFSSPEDDVSLSDFLWSERDMEKLGT